MPDSLISLIKIAGITLLITLLWALTLATAYWDLQRRQRIGERVSILGWMILVMCLPLIGWIAYWSTRLVNRKAMRSAESKASPASRRQTKLKSPMLETVQPHKPTLTIPSGVERHSNPPLLALAPASIPHYRFSVVSGPERGKQFLIDRFPAQIGRTLDSAIRLELDTSVSRQHALIFPVDGHLHIRDLQSSHGTRLNGEPANGQILKAGDQIEVGMTSLFVHQVNPESNQALL